MVRRIVDEYSALEALFARVLPGPDGRAGEVGSRDAVEELRAALESRFSAEEDLYYPTIWALRPEYEDRLRSFIRAHHHFRGLIREITGLIESREMEEAFRLLEGLEHELARHETEEEDALHALDREIQIDESGAARFERSSGSSRGGYTGRRRVVSRIAGVAAAAAALILLPFVFSELRGPGVDDPTALADSILREIALNHSKNQKVEFSADDYPGLREQMDRLDFTLLSPRRISGRELQMLGGRYCSLQGRLAAQIKLEDEAGRVLTLYQTSFSGGFEGLSEQRRELDGIQIRIWREGDLLFGLAGPEI